MNQSKHSRALNMGRPLTRGAVMSHAEIAKALGLSRQRVEQIEMSALKKLAKKRVLRELSK